ncbi:MAG: 50S ribosomal protein L1 [Patescibacteria group bacterium]|nr:50S ribosomal protein L1 [Patescibacteria group bacterium]
MKQGKRYRNALKSYEQKKIYSLDEALDILEKFPKPKFNESIEIHVRLNINPKKSDQQVRGTVILPHGTGKVIRIAAFTDTQQKEAKKMRASVVGGQELIDKIATSGGAIDFDVAVATPEIMPKMAKIAKILGPKGLMPNKKSETVGTKIDVLIGELKKGKASFKNDNDGNIHQVIGSRSFSKKKLKENADAFLKELGNNKPSAAKGKFVKTVNITATMSPSIRIQ